MADPGPPAKDNKFAFVAPIVIGAAVLALLSILLFRNSPSPGPEPLKPPAQPPAAATTGPLAPEPEGPLTRTDLVLGAAQESASFADGAPSPTAVSDMSGRAFIVRIPFGCDGPQTSPGAAQILVERNTESGSTRLIARPSDWSVLPAIKTASASAPPESAEGFWIPRPWSFAETCPRPRDLVAPPTPTPASTPTLGLLQLHDTKGSRLQRRDGRPYEFTLKPATVGAGSILDYRLVLEGRIGRFPNGRVVQCAAESADHRPVCFYAVALERVAFETADGKQLAEWRE